MNFKDLLTQGKRDLKVMLRMFPYNISDQDRSDWTLEENNMGLDVISPEWYIEVFP